MRPPIRPPRVKRQANQPRGQVKPSRPRQANLTHAMTARPTASGVDTGSMSMAKWSSLSPLAQMSLSFVRPGTFNCPFVEANGAPSRAPTTVIHGETEFSITATAAAKYTGIFLCPSLGYNSDTGSSGVSVANSGIGTDTFTLPMTSGESFTNLYGSSAIFSRYRILATRLEVVFDAPEATLAGSAFIGSMQISALNGSTWTSLVDCATKTYDLKQHKTFELKAFLSDRSLAHETCTSSSIADEWVSYIIFSKSPARSITDGTTLPYTQLVKAHSNVLWNPVLSSPVMNGIATRAPDSVLPPPPVQLELANICQARAAEPEPPSLSAIAKMVHAATSGGRVAHLLAPVSRGTATGPSGLSGNLSDPSLLVPDFRDRISNLGFVCTLLRRLAPLDDPEEDILSHCSQDLIRLIDRLQVLQAESDAVRQTYSECSKSLEESRSGSRIVYRLPDGTLYSHLSSPKPRSGSAVRSTSSGFTRT